MVDVWPVIGDAHTHKTTTIRALTGVRGIERQWLVAYAPGGQTAATYVQPGGLQEASIDANTFIADVIASGVNHVIVALRYDPWRGYPNAAAYLTAFVGAGWNVPAHAVLGRPVIMAGYAGIAVPNAAALPSNEVARQVRANWGIA